MLLTWRLCPWAVFFLLSVGHGHLVGKKVEMLSLLTMLFAVILRCLLFKSALLAI